MEIAVKAGAIQEQSDELIVVNLFEGVKQPGGATGAVDRAVGGAITRLIQSGDFVGKSMETALLRPENAPFKRVLVVGLGKADKFDLEAVRKVSAKAARTVRDLGVKRFTTIVHGAGSGGLSPRDAAQALAEGTLLGTYQLSDYRTTKRDEIKNLDGFTVVEADTEKLAQVEEGIHWGRVFAEGTCVARDLVNMPSNDCTPTKLVETAKGIASRHGMAIKVLTREEARDMGMGLFWAVSKSAAEPAYVIILEHKPAGAKAGPVAFVGKGLTFDTGGISIKPSQNLEQMKMDMGGGAAVLGAMEAIGALKLPVHVVAVVPTTDNMPDGNAYKPGDILRSLDGQTVEVISTDAEGRLILADALTYVQREYRPQAIIDLATLTGACVIALGDVNSGFYVNDESLEKKLKSAAAKTGEKIWHMPLDEDYEEQNKSDLADIKNTGGRMAGSITAALFLKRFVKEVPWAHLDIAGTAWMEKDRTVNPKGASGVGVRLLAQYAADLASQ